MEDSCGMNAKIRDVLFFLMSFSLIFNSLPKQFAMRFMGGPLGGHLMFYPFFIGLIYAFWCQYKYRNMFVNYEEFRRFNIFYLTIVLLSLVIGLYNYPYYDLILAGPVEQVERIPKLLVLFGNFGIDINAKQLLSFWMFARPIKSLLFYIIYTFGVSYIVYCWYYKDWKQAIEVLKCGVVCSVFVCITYSSVEILYLSHNENAKQILELINPYIHAVKEHGSWWPPLLWKGQLRSVFAEPSYFGIYAAFCIPFLWLMIIRSKFDTKCAYIYMIVTLVMTFLLILTKARTGFMLHIGELVIFSLLLCYLRDSNLFKKGIAIFLCSAIAFVGGNLFIYKCIDNERLTNTSFITFIYSYIDSNAISLANPDKRSNRARYSVIESDIKVGLEHPLLGVGSGLRTAYVIDAFSEKALQNDEVKMWLDFNNRLGILKFGIPKLGEYTSRFCETGSLGLLAFLVPPLYLVMTMIKRLKKLTIDTQIIHIIYLTSFAGIIASGIGDALNITYCYWVLLGLGYAMCFGKQKEKIDDEST